MKTTLQLLFHLFVFSAFGQTTLSGYLTEKDTGLPVEFATAYVNGTTIGAVSDDKGFFELKNVVFPLDLVLSHLSYESAVLHLETASDQAVKVALKSRSVNLKSIKVVDNDLRKRNVQQFIESFIGVDEFGREAKLTNDEVLLFKKEYEQVKSPGSNTTIIIGGKDMINNKAQERPVNMKVTARAPLVIDQPMLGYKVRVDLESFELNYGRRFGQYRTAYWLGFYFYEPYNVEKERLQKRYERNREKAFYHSPQHFLQALYNQELGVNGYQIFERKVNPKNNQKDIVRFDITPYLKYTDDGILVIAGLKDKTLDILYYPNSNGKPKDVSKRGKGLPLQSLVKFMDEQCIVRQDGTMPGYSLRFGGVISEKKVGAMLPDNYQIGGSMN